MATISEVGQLCGVDRDTIIRWTREFAEHFTLSARPPKGKQRQFSETDLRALALIAFYWEEERSDLEHIHAMLNCGDHHKEKFVEFARLHSPVFPDAPDDIDETWRRGVLIGGESRDWARLARSYKMAADELATQALAEPEPNDEIGSPIFFLYRHSIELYLKAMLKEDASRMPHHHIIDELLKRLESQAKREAGGWIRDRLLDFHNIDKMSDIFRYPEHLGPVMWIDLCHLKAVMNRLAEAFERHIAMATKVDPFT